MGPAWDLPKIERLSVAQLIRRLCTFTSPFRPNWKGSEKAIVKFPFNKYVRVASALLKTAVPLRCLCQQLNIIPKILKRKSTEHRDREWAK